MKRLAAASGLVTTIVALATAASAHVNVVSGPAFASVAQDVVFEVAHGCDTSGGATADTVKVVFDIPAGVTGVRPVPNVFGKFTVTGNPVTNVTYEKAPADYLDSDSALYKFTIRLTLPAAPFTRLYVPVHQHCNGVAKPVDWTPPGAGVPDAGDGPAIAPDILILPPRQPGWNKFTVPVEVKELAVFFKDALIVWRGTAAFSPNPNTASQISAEPTAGALTRLNANDEIWVKY